MTYNFDSAMATYIYLLRHIGQWSQDTWRAANHTCGTAYCYAGFHGARVDAQWALPIDYKDSARKMSAPVGHAMVMLDQAVHVQPGEGVSFASHIQEKSRRVPASYEISRKDFYEQMSQILTDFGVDVEHDHFKELSDWVECNLGIDEDYAWLLYTSDAADE